MGPSPPRDQVRLRFRLKDQSGAPIEHEVYLTVYQVPED